MTFLRAQLDEDEKRAQRMVSAVWPVAVHVVPTEDTGDSPRGSISAAPGVPKRFQRMWDGGTFEHGWVVHESAVEVWSREIGEQLLRDVTAKRAIIDAYDHKIESMARYPNQGNANGMYSLAVAVQHLASAYSNRPGYRGEWGTAR